MVRYPPPNDTIAADHRPPLAVRVALVVAAAIVIWLAVYATGRFFGPAAEDRLGHALRAVLTTALVVPLVLIARRRLDRRPLAGLGLAPPGAAWRPFLAGAGFWLAAAGLGLAATLGLGWARIDRSPPTTGILLLALALPVLVFLYEALPEELIFRGYLYRNLADRLPRWVALLVQAALFTLFGWAIGAAGSLDRLILFFTFSLTLGLLRALTGSLWAPIGFHLAFQWVTQLTAQAVRDGVVRVSDQATLDLVVFWFFPIVLGGVALLLWSITRRRFAWGEREADPPDGGAPDRLAGAPRPSVATATAVVRQPSRASGRD